MSIKEVTLYEAYCDGCNERFEYGDFTAFYDIEDHMRDDDSWHIFDEVVEGVNVTVPTHMTTGGPFVVKTTFITHPDKLPVVRHERTWVYCWNCQIPKCPCESCEETRQENFADHLAYTLPKAIAATLGPMSHHPDNVSVTGT